VLASALNPKTSDDLAKSVETGFKCALNSCRETGQWCNALKWSLMAAGRVVSFSIGSRASCASSFAREKGPKRVEIIETSGGLKACRSNIGIGMAGSGNH